MKIKKILLFLPLAFCLLSMLAVNAYDVHNDLSANLLRLHIIGNSNSERDQMVKLSVRDGVLKNINATSTLSDVTEIANGILKEADANYTASVQIRNRFVPKKEYKSIALPEGFYSCLDIILGSGNGENWWCIAYPPLCFTEEVVGEISKDGEKLLLKNLDKKTFNTIIKNGDVNFKFKIVELFQKCRYGI